MSITSVMPSNHVILCHHLLLLPSVFPSIRVFFNESVLRIRWPKYWSFSFSISPSNEYSGLIFFRMDWLDLCAVQGTLKVFSNTTVQKHQFFSTPPSLWSNSHPYITTGKTIALTIQAFAGKAMSLLFNMLSGFVWLQSPSAVILEPKKLKSVIVSPSIYQEVMGPYGTLSVIRITSISCCSDIYNHPPPPILITDSALGHSKTTSHPAGVYLDQRISS